jgi:aryl-phospho-beta-D-glucosidase BglC (GH1 family)
MESSFFSCAGGSSSSEMDILLGFGSTAAGISNATAYMEQHWDTWITEADFQKMASMGINTVRIPVGYWSAGPYFANNSAFETYADVYYYSWRYVARAINWAAKYDIGVLVDLHGAYGSQNGQDHSGVSDGVIGFFTSAHMTQTTNLLVWMTQQLANVTNIVGIELLNEPVNRASLWPWYYRTMDAMRAVSSSIPLYFHDAFNGAQGAAFVANRTDFIVQDHHSYYVYTPSDTAKSAKDHITDVNGSIKDRYDSQSATARRNLVQGEWSCALAPKSLSQAVNQTFAQMNFCTDQEAVYRETSSGFMFWSWTMDNCKNNGGWCFQQAVKKYLPSSFDSWGLVNVTAPMMNLTTTSSSGMSKLTSQISAIDLPALATSNLKVKTINTKTSTTSVSPPEVARIGMVGSLASRANNIVQQEKRASSTSAYASASGWSDGFLSAQIFANQGKLSRIGFAPQYQIDSFKLRLSAGEVVKSDASAYNATFISGIQAAEKLIAQLINDFEV